MLTKFWSVSIEEKADMKIYAKNLRIILKCVLRCVVLNWIFVFLTSHRALHFSPISSSVYLSTPITIAKEHNYEDLYYEFIFILLILSFVLGPDIPLRYSNAWCEGASDTFLETV
jgi:hypothetical protein